VRVEDGDQRKGVKEEGGSGALETLWW
jgi:hypothetical protein